MHWLNVVLLVLLSGLVLTLTILFLVMWSNRPTEVGRIADEPDPFQPRLSLPRLQLPAMDSDDAVRLQALSDDDLVRELQQLMAESALLVPGAADAAEADGTAPADEAARDARAQQHLAQMTRTSGQADGVCDYAAHMHVGEGRGIVICAGGFALASSAHVLLRLLRDQGCTLPVEVWHRDRETVSADWAGEWRRLGPVELRNVDAVSGAAFTNAFAIKPLAVYHSRFREVLLLDADNVTAADPTPLFDEARWPGAADAADGEEEKDPDTYSAVFWPDYWPLDKRAKCWQALTEEQRAQVRDVTQDSGQLLVNKRYCMDALALCCRVNVQLGSQLPRLFPGPLNTGDKDTWHFAWLATGTPFKFLDQPRAGGAGSRDHTGQYIGTTIVQHDLRGEPLFLHKCWAKWGTETHKPQWTDVYTWLTNRGNVNQWTHAFENGPVSREPFAAVFGDLEDRCWAALDALRAQPWYQQEHKQELADLGL